jgi:hypothetical protein
MDGKQDRPSVARSFLPFVAGRRDLTDPAHFLFGNGRPTGYTGGRVIQKRRSIL